MDQDKMESNIPDQVEPVEDLPQEAALQSTGTRAVVNLGIVSVKDYGAEGDGVHDDTTAIQNALNTGNPVYIPDGSYKVTATIIMPISSQLTLSNKAKLLPYTNVNVLRVRNGCRVSGGTIDLTKMPSFSAAAIYVDGADQIWLDQASVDDMHIKGGTLRQAKGIVLECNADKEYICFCWFTKIVINNCNIGVQLKCSGNGAFVNGNTFDTLVFDKCIYGIRVEHDTDKSCEVTGNHFMKVQFDISSATRNYIYCTGHHNNFHFMPWDLGYNGSTATCIELTSTSQYNAIFLNNAAFSKYIVNKGTNNWFIYK